MSTNDIYKFLIHNPVKYSLGSLQNTTLPVEIQGILAVVGLPELELFDAIGFEPCESFKQENHEELFYYRLGTLMIDGFYYDTYIDTKDWKIWLDPGTDAVLLNSDLTSFLLFMELYSFSILTNTSKVENRDTLLRQYTQLKSQFEVIDHSALLTENSLWFEVLEAMRNFYPE